MKNLIKVGAAVPILKHPIPLHAGLDLLKLALTSFFILSCLWSAVGAATVAPTMADNDKPQVLRVGDKMPESLLAAPMEAFNHPEGKKSLTLNDFKGKLLILDFWATSCRGCIASMPRMQELNEQFKGKAVILPVTWQEQDEILKTSHISPAFNLLQDLYSITSDELLRARFPHRMIPHTVWIDPEGDVIGITGGGEVTADNITDVLDGGGVALKEKKDVLDYNFELPLLLNDNGAKHTAFVQQSTFTEMIEGVPSIITNKPTKNTADHTFRFTSTNMSPMTIYKSVVADLYLLPKNRFIYKTDDQTQEELNTMFCYQLIAPLDKYDGYRTKIVQDLNNYFSVRVSLDTVPALSYVISPIAGSAQRDLATADGLERLSTLVYQHNNEVGSLPLLADEALLKSELRLPKDIVQLAQLAETNQALKPYGLQIHEEERPLAFFTIRQVP